MNRTIVLIFCLLLVLIKSEPELGYKHLNKSQILGNESKGIYELREYEGFIIATTNIEDRDEGFHILELYTGRFDEPPSNKENVTIKFIWPVLTNQVMQGSYNMSFVINCTKVPTPTDRRIQIARVQQAVWAVKKFSWNYSWKSGINHLLQLFLELRSDGLLPKTMRFRQLKQFMVAHYSHKLTVPFMKRHEVWIKVELERDINMIK